MSLLPAAWHVHQAIAKKRARYISGRKWRARPDVDVHAFRVPRSQSQSFYIDRKIPVPALQTFSRRLKITST